MLFSITLLIKITSMLYWKERPVKKMKLENQKQRQVFLAVSTYGTDTTQEAYEIAFILGNRDKRYGDACIKICIFIEAVSCLDTDDINKYKKLSLSPDEP